MTNAERRDRRREAARKGAMTRKAKAAAGPPPAEPFAGPQPARMDLVRRAQALGLGAQRDSGGACTSSWPVIAPASGPPARSSPSTPR